LIDGSIDQNKINNKGSSSSRRSSSKAMFERSEVVSVVKSKMKICEKARIDDKTERKIIRTKYQII
jgi:hypothetical protein